MASFPDLRPRTRSAKAGSTAVGRFRRPVILAVSAALLLTAFLAVSELATLRGKKASDASAYLTRTLGPPLDSARLVRRPERGTSVDLAKPARVKVTRKGGTISLAATGTGAAPWRHFVHGVTRSTPYGAETITIAPGQTEQFLTVDEHHGTHTWEWKLGTKLEPKMLHNGLIELASSKGATPEYELMPAAILDTNGKNITPAGLRWTLKKAHNSWSLLLKLDDTPLPVPYVIDPAIVFDVASSGGNNASNTLTWNHTVANQPNRMLIVAYNSENTGTASCQPTSVTYNGVAMNLAGQIVANTPSPNWDCVGIYYLANPANGIHAVAINFTGVTPTNDSISATAMSIYSVSQNAPDAVASSQAAGLTSTNITTVWPNSWVVDGIGLGDLSGNLAVSAGQTSRQIKDSAGTNSTAMSSKAVAAVGSTTMSWTRTPAPNRSGQVVIALSQLDNTAPSAPTVTPSESDAFTYVSGTTVYYNAQGTNSGGFTVDATSSDTDSGIKKINFPAVTGTTGGGDDLTSPYQGVYTWNSSTNASGAQTVTVTNGQNLTSTGTFTMTKDVTNPTGSLTAPASSAIVRGSSVAVSSNSADAGSGVASAQFQYSPAGAGTWTNVGAADTTSPYSVNWDTTAVADGLYDLRVITTDNVSNTFTSALVTNVRVDNTLPTNSLSLQSLSPAGAAFLNGSTVYYRGAAAGNFQLRNTVTDAGSGPASSIFPALGGTVGTWTHTTQTVNTPAGGPYTTTNNFAWSAGETNSPTESVTSTDTAGNSSTASVLTFTNDSTNPTGSVTAPAASANVSGSSVTVSSNSADGGSGVASAQFQRSPAGAGTWTNIGAADTTSPYSVNWDTTAVADGLYDLRVLTTDNVGNTFTSALVTNVRVDNTLPTSVLSLSSISPAGSAFQNGSTIYYRGSAAGSFQLQNTVSDAGSGPASAIFPALGGTVGTWTHTAQTVNTPAGGPYVTTNNFAWSAGETNSPTESATSTDAAGNTSSATVLTFTNDSTNPTGSITAPSASANVRGSSVTVSSNSADGGAGVASAQFQRSPAGAGTWTNIGSADTTSPYSVTWDSTAVADGLYDLRVITTDNVGNTFTSALVTNVRVDNTLPTNALSLSSSSPAGSAFQNGSTVYYRGAAAGSFQLQNAVSDAGSGPASSIFPALGGTVGSWTHTAQTVNSPAGGPYVTTNNFAWSAGETNSPTESVTSTDNAGNTSGATVLTFTNDSTSPTGSLTAPSASAVVRGSSVTVSSNSADGGSGVASAQFQRSPAGAGTWTNIGSADTTSPYSVSWDSTAVADGLYDLRVVTTDNVGNTFTSAVVTNVMVDNTLPTNALSLSSISPAGSSFQNGSTVYYRGSAAGSFQLQNAVSDGGSGPASSIFPALGGTVGTWTHTAQTVNTPAGGPYVTTNNFAWSAGETNSPTESVTATDTAGNTSSAAVLTFTNDSTNPTGSVTAPSASVNVSGSSVTVSSNSTDGGSGVASAQFQRSPAGAGTWTNIGSADTTSPYSVSWDTTAVADGLYDLRVITTDNVGNTFTSALVTNVRVDNTKPTNSLSLSSSSPVGSAFQNGSTIYYRGSAAGSLQLQNAVTDGGSGPASSIFPALGGTVGTWTHTAQTVNTPAGGPYVTTNNFAWSAGETNSPTESVTSTDTAGNTSNASLLTFTNDSTNPTGSITAPAASANVTGSSVTVSSNSADGGSGVASAQFQRSPAGAGTWTNIGAADTTSPYSVNWDTTAVADGLYDLRVITTDNVGNTFTSALVTNVRVDNTLPTNSLSLQSISPAGAAFQNGSTIYYRGSAAGNLQIQNTVSDSGSGPASAIFPALGGTVGTWTHTAQTVNTPAGGPYTTTNNFAWSAGETNSPTESVTSTDNAGNTSNATVLTFTNDSTNPTGSLTAPASSANVSGSTVTVSSNSADGGSGVASAQFQRSPAGAGTWTNIGSADTTAPYSGNWDTTAVADGLYDLRVFTTDNVGNTFTSALVTNVRVDNTKPTNSLSLQSISPAGSAFQNGSTIYYRGSAAGNFQLQNAVSDAGSGPASSIFPALGGTVGTWTHTAQTVNTPAGGPYTTTNNFAWSAGEANSPTESVTSTDTAGNSSNASVLTFTNDSTNPTGSLTAPSASAVVRGSSVTVSSNSADGGSGVASAQFQRSPAGAGTWTNIGSADTTSPYSVSWDSTAVADGLYDLRVITSDNVGNSFTSGLVTNVLVDNTAPANALSLSGVSPSGSAYQNGSTVYYRGAAAGSFQLQNAVTDGGSGPASSIFPALGGTVGTWTHTTQTVNTPAGGPYTTTNNFAWSAGETNSPTESVTSTDTAGNTSGATVLTFTNDSTNPTGSVTAPSASAVVRGSSVTVSSNSADGGSGVASAQFQRSPAGAGTWTNIGSADTTSPYSVSWDTTAVADGLYDLRVMTTDNVGNTFTSALVTNVRVDNTLPTNSLSLQSVSPAGATFLNGSTAYYRGSAAGTFQLQNAVSDAGSGPASAIFPALGGTVGTWTHTAQTVNTPAGGPYVTTNNFAWSAGETNSPTESVTSTDTAGNTSNASVLTFTNDSTNPTGSVTAPSASANVTGSSVTVSSNSADGGSGVASAQFQRSPAGAGTWTNIGAADTTSPYSVSWDTTAVADGLYDLRVITTDNVGNTFTSALVTNVRVDNTLPTNAITVQSASPAGSAYKSGSTLYYRGAAAGSFQLQNAVSDAGSGPASSIFPVLGGTVGTWTHTAQTVNTPAGGPYVTTNNFAWSAGETNSPTESVTSTDTAGNTSNATVLTFTNDSTSPTVTAPTVAAGYYTTASVPVATNGGSDGGSGVDPTTSIVQRDEVALTGGSCGSFPGTWSTVTLTAGSDTTVVSGTCYRYRELLSDNVGNQGTSGPSNVAKVDTSAPFAPSLAFSNLSANAYWNGSGTLYFRPSAGGAFTVTASSTDAESGVASYGFASLNSNGGSNWSGTQTGDHVDYTFNGATTAPGTPRTVNATNSAGSTSANATYSIVADTTAPSVSAPTVTAGYYSSLSVPVATNGGSDGGAGVDPTTSIVERDDAPLTNGSCGGFSGTWSTVTLVAGSDTSVLNGRCYEYRERLSDRVGNQGTSGSSSIAKVDAQGPSNSISLGNVSPAGTAYKSGTTVYYRGVAGGGGSFTLTNAVSDGESGAQSSATAALGGSAAGWSHTPSMVSTPAGGPFDSNSFSWSAGTTSSPTEDVTGADVAGNTTTTTLTFTDDSSAPAGGALTVNGVGATGAGTTSYSSTGSFPIDSRTDYSEAQSATASGLAQSTLTRATATLAGNTCGSFGSATTIGGTPNQNGLPAGCYLYTLTGTDNVGNAVSVQTTVKVDTDNPSVTLTNPGTPLAGTVTLNATASDPSSSIQNVSFQRSPAGSSTWTTIATDGTSPYGASFDTTGVADGLYDLRAVAMDAAGNTSSDVVANLEVDNTAPQTTIDSGPNDPSNDPTPTFTFSSSEPGSTFECRIDGGGWTTCTSPDTLSPALAEGSHSFDVRATDQAGNTDGSPASQTWTVDLTAPVTTLDSGPGSPSNDSTPTFAFSSNEPGSTFQCRIDGGSWTSCSSPYTTAALSEATHTLDVRAVDPAGNTDATPASQTWTIDLTAPSTSIDSAPADPSNNTTPTFAFSATEPGSTFGCRIDGGSWTTCSSPFTTPSLGAGSHTFDVRATDPAGNTDGSPASFTWTIDLAAPSTTIDSGPPDPSNNTAPSFAFSSSEIGSTFECRIDGGSWTTCTSPDTTPALGQGSHTFDVRATDAAGNTDASPASQTWTIDTTAPQTTIDSTPPSPSNDTTPTFAFSSNESGSSFECRIDGGSWTSCSSPDTTAVLSEATHTFDVRATDQAGNTDGTPASFTWTIDLTAPSTTIDSAPADPSNNTTPTFAFSATEPGSTFECRIDGGGWSSCSSPFTTPSLGAGTHTFDVRATDPAGNTDGSPASFTWTIDLTAPDTTIGSAPPALDNDATPTFTFTSTEVGSTFECRIDGSSWTTCTTPYTTAALAEGTHTFDVRATDAAGNTDPSPAAHTWSIDLGPPSVTITAPTTYINSSDPSVYSVTATTPDADVSRVDFYECSNTSVACSTGTWTLFDSDSTAPFSGNWTTPGSDGTRAIRAVAVDLANNTGADVKTITIDRTAPSGVTVSYPNGYVTGSFAITTGNGPDTDVDASTATLERQTGNLASDTCSSYSGWTAASSPDSVASGNCAIYQYRVADNAGNWSVATSGNVVKSDTSAPSSAQADPGANLRQTVTLTSSASDTGGSGLESVDFQRRPAGGGSWTTIAADTASPYSVSFDTTSVADGLYDFRTVATDVAGNIETSPTVVANRRIDNTPPSATMISPGNPVRGSLTLTSTTSDGGSGINTVTYELAPHGGGFNTQPASWDTTLGADGLYDLRVTATDVAGNSTTSPLVTTRVDNTPPALTFSSPASGATVSGTVTLTASSSDASPASPPISFAYKLHSAPASAYMSTGSSWNTITLPAGDGLYDLRAQATDDAANTTTVVNASVLVDNIPPNVAITAPAPAINGSLPSPTSFSATASDPSGSGVQQVQFFECSDQSVNCATGVWSPLGTVPAPGPYTVSWNIPASDGNHALAAVATDNAGHSSSAIRNVSVDRTAPDTTIAGKPADPSNAATPTFTFSSTESGSTFECRADGGSWSPCTSPDTISGLTDGAHTFDVRATDTAGNTDPSPDSWTWHRDTAGPAATLSSPGANVRQTVTLTSAESDPPANGYASGLASVTYEYSANGTTWATIGTLSSVPFDTILWNTTGVADGVYQLRIVAYDVAGNSTTSTAVTNVRVDNTPPTTSQNNPGQYLRATKTLSGSAADSGSGVDHVDFQQAPAGSGSWTTIATSLTSPFSVAFDTTTVADGHYDFRTVAYDVAGNQAASTPISSRLVDNTPPSATLNDPGAYLRGAVNLTSATSDPGGANASGVVGVAYEYSTSGGATWQPTASTFDSTSVADGNVQLHVVATDAAGNATTSAPLTKLVDNTKPNTTDNAPSGWQSSAVTVTLSPSDAGSGVNATEYSVDGSPTYTVGTSVVIPAPADGSNDGAHTIAYFSVDNAGNIESVKSTTVLIDATPPACPSCTAANYLRGTVTLSASPSAGGSGLQSVAFEYADAGSSTWTTIGTDTTGPAPYTANWDTTTVPDGLYDLRIVTTDNAANVTTTDLPGKVVDNTAPNVALVGAPTQGQLVSGTISIAASAADATSPIASVQFIVNGNTLGTDTTAPFSLNWNTTSVPDGAATIQVVVTDMAGNSTTSPVRDVTVDNVAPTPTLANPGQNLSGTVSLSASSDPDTTQVDFEQRPAGGGAWVTIASDSTLPWGTSLDTTTLADGLYDFRVLATDGSGQTGTSPIRANVRIDNTAPSGSITAPGAGATVGGPSVTLSASVADGGSGVASVAYELRPTGGGSFTQIASASSAPFSATWDATTVATGSYDLRPVVTDRAGNTFTGPVVTFNVDVTAPTVTLTNPGATISGTVTLNATVTGSGATKVIFAASPAGGASWTSLGTDTASPWSIAFDTTKLSDGVYDLRATVYDGLGNTSQDVVTSIRIDNTAPQVVSSTPADGSTVASASAISLVTNEVATPVGVTLDGGSTVAPVVSGTHIDYNTGALAVGAHILAGTLQDASGKTAPFRVHFTVYSGSGSPPPVNKNTSPSAGTTVTSADGFGSATMPSGAWSVSGNDWIVLRIVPATAPTGLTNGFAPGPEALDVSAHWALSGLEVHQFSQPIEITIHSTETGLVPATYDGTAWRVIHRVPTPGTLPAGWDDGFFTDANGFHVLTKHLSLFALLKDVEAPQAPQNVRGYVGAGGLTIRWLPGDDNSGTYDYVTLFSDSTDSGHFAPDFTAASVAGWQPGDPRIFRLQETDLAGNKSDVTPPLLQLPSLIGLTPDQAEAVLAKLGLSLGSVTVGGAGQPGTITGPEGLALAPQGASIDVTVAGNGASAGFAFKVVTAPRFKPAARKKLAARVTVTRPARVTAQLFSPRRVKLYTWRAKVRAGGTILRLAMPRQVRRLGVYTMVWSGRAGRQTVTRTIKFRVVGKRLPKQRIQIVLAGAAAKSVGPRLARRSEMLVDGVEPTFDATANRNRDVRVLVVDVDDLGLATLRDLHAVFPAVKIVALAAGPKTMAASLKAGAKIVLPRSTPPAKLAKIIQQLAKKR